MNLGSRSVVSECRVGKIVLIFFCFGFSLCGQEVQKLETRWSVAMGFELPESAYLDPSSNQLFVSNMGGTPLEKNGKGRISKLSFDGKLIESQWAVGLNSPKGMRSYGGVLWVTSVSELVAIKIGRSDGARDGEIIKRLSLPGAICLSDIAISEVGDLYVSDVVGNQIFQLSHDSISTFASGTELESPNGLALQGGKLIVASSGPMTDSADPAAVPINGHLFSLDLVTKKKVLITDKAIGRLDGLEVDRNGNYLVSDWLRGILYRVSQSGNVEELGRFQGNTADFSLSVDKQTLYLPLLLQGQVIALKLR